MAIKTIYFSKKMKSIYGPLLREYDQQLLQGSGLKSMDEEEAGQCMVVCSHADLSAISTIVKSLRTTLTNKNIQTLILKPSYSTGNFKLSENFHVEEVDDFTEDLAELIRKYAQNDGRPDLIERLKTGLRTSADEIEFEYEPKDDEDIEDIQEQVRDTVKPGTLDLAKEDKETIKVAEVFEDVEQKSTQPEVQQGLQQEVLKPVEVVLEVEDKVTQVEVLEEKVETVLETVASPSVKDVKEEVVPQPIVKEVEPVALVKEEIPEPVVAVKNAKEDISIVAGKDSLDIMGRDPVVKGFKKKLCMPQNDPLQFIQNIKRKRGLL